VTSQRQITQPTVLVVGGAHDSLPVLRALRDLGVRLVVADGSPAAPGFRLADAGILAATFDPDSTVEAARAYASRTPIVGVIGTSRRLALAVASIGDALGLAALPIASARRMLDRLAVRETLDASGLRVPPARAVASPNDVRAACQSYGAPLLVRPVDGWAARGVVRVLAEIEPSWAFHVASTASPTGQAMVEPFVAGRAVSAVALVNGTCPVLLDVSERTREERFAPFVIDAGYQGPCDLRDEERAQIAAAVAAAVEALDLRNVLCTVELVLTNDGALVVDVETGLTNGRRLVHAITLAAGIDPIAGALRVALGEALAPSELTPRWQRPVAERSIFADPGVVIEVRDAEAVAATDGIALVDVYAVPGARVCPPTSNLCRGGVVLATGASTADAGARARDAAARIQIVTEAAPVTADPRTH